MLLATTMWGQTTNEINDTLRASRIIDKYLRMIDILRSDNDSVLCVETSIVARERPQDTMKIYQWYKNPRNYRLEMWQDGQVEEGFYSDGTIFKMFRPSARDWVDVLQHNFYDYTIPHDFRGALYDWRSKGAEVRYAGEYTFEGQKVDRIFVSSPGIFDRYYFFEKETGLLFMVTEMDHIYGDSKKTKDAMKVDWRAWNEFTPFRGYLVPTIESYQAEQHIVTIKRSYHFEANQPTLFNQDFRKAK